MTRAPILSAASFFYECFADDLKEDSDEVQAETRELWQQADALGRFELTLLDNDGGTTQIEQALRKGQNLFYLWGYEGRKKYGRLLPADVEVNPVLSFEEEWLDPDCRTASMERDLNRGIDIFELWPEEVRAKYRDFIPHDFKLREFNREFLHDDGGTIKIQGCLKEGNDISQFHPQMKESY